MRKTLIILTGLAMLVLACGGGTTTSSDGPPGAGSRGEALFKTHCTLCHGKDGKLGVSGAKDLSVSSLTKEEMTALVTNGKGAMAAYKNVLTKAEIEAVVEHVRTLQAAE